MIDEKVDQVLKETSMEISKRYPIYFLEIGTDKDHVHFLVQSVPKYSPTQIVRVIKSITAREVICILPGFHTKDSLCYPNYKQNDIERYVLLRYYLR